MQATAISNQAANLLASAPPDLKAEWGVGFREIATNGMRNLLAGSTHICPSCGYDGSPVDPRTGHVFRCGCDKPNVHAVRLYAEMEGAIGPQNVVAVNLFAGLGLSGPDEARSVVALVRDAEQRSPFERAELMCQALTRMAADDEAIMGLVRRMLAGLGSGAKVEP